MTKVNMATANILSWIDPGWLARVLSGSFHLSRALQRGSGLRLHSTRSHHGPVKIITNRVKCGMSSSVPVTQRCSVCQPQSFDSAAVWSWTTIPSMHCTNVYIWPLTVNSSLSHTYLNVTWSTTSLTTFMLTWKWKIHPPGFNAFWVNSWFWDLQSCNKLIKY